MTAYIEKMKRRQAVAAAGGKDATLKRIGHVTMATRASRIVVDKKGRPLKVVSTLEVNCALPGHDPIVFIEDVECPQAEIFPKEMCADERAARTEAATLAELAAIEAAMISALGKVLGFAPAARSAWIGKAVGPERSQVDGGKAADPRKPVLTDQTTENSKGKRHV